MFLLALVELVIASVIVLVFLSEILIPLLGRKPIFPSFRRLGKLGSEARKANEMIEEERLAEEIRQMQEEAKRVSFKNEQ